jgi:hypothetical protein
LKVLLLLLLPPLLLLLLWHLDLRWVPCYLMSCCHEIVPIRPWNGYGIWETESASVCLRRKRLLVVT